MYSNINGYLSKKDSLANIVQSLDPDIIALCETKKAGRIRKQELSTYKVRERNLKPGKEGILIGVRKGTFNTVEEITDTEMKNIMTLKIGYPTFNLRVVVAHAPQESDKVEARQEFFEELSVQVERCLTSGDELVVLGDLNGRIAWDVDCCVAVNDSPNGKQVCELIKKHGLKVGNFHPQCTGKWTRIQPCKKGEDKKSVLDYVLMTDTLQDSLLSIVIDEEKIYCPYRVIKEKGQQKIVYSDHCTISSEFTIDIGQTKNKVEKTSGWKYSEDGYCDYQIESEASMLFDLTAPSTSQVYSSWVTAFEKVLAKCFRRHTFKKNSSTVAKIGNTKHREIRKVILEISRKGKIQRAVAKIYQQKLIEMEVHLSAEARAERLKTTAATLTVNERFSPNGYWKLKKAANKNVRKDQVMSTIVKEDGVEVEGEKGIVQAYQDEFVKRLANREPAPGWEEYTTETNTVVRNWLLGDSQSSPPFSPDELDKVLATLNEDSSPGVDMYPPKVFTKAGAGVLTSILSLCNRVKELRSIPEQWEFVRIVTIYKQKGSRKKLKYYRGIFLAIVMSKIFEKLVKNRIEGNLQQINLLQAARKNRGPAESVFLFRGTMDHYKFTGKSLYVTAYDFEQAFDSLWLEDCLLSLKEVGVEKEYLQLIYNLNKRAKVIVQTPCGPTAVFETAPIVKQGTVLGPCLCSASTGEYCAENPGVCVGCATISALVYVDDIIELSSSIEDFLSSHQKALLFAKRKKLKFSGSKCYWMVLNRKTKNGTIPILRIDEENIVLQASEIIYLGDVFNELGNNDGLIADRVRRGTQAMITIASLMAEIEVGSHHVEIMLLLYRALFLSTMLFNSQTWSNLRKKDIDCLRTLQLKFLKRILGVASSTPNAFTFLELGVLPIEYEIEKRQIMFLHRILQMDPADPVFQLFEEMQKFSEAGEKNWWTGVEKCLGKYKLPTDFDKIKSMTKESFSTLVKKAVTRTALESLKVECAGLKKTAVLKYDSLKLQEYLSVLHRSHSKIIFKWRCQTLDIKSHSTWKYNDLVCRGCGVENEDSDHVINCGSADRIETELNIINLDNLDQPTKNELMQIVLRMKTFLDNVDNNGSNDDNEDLMSQTGCREDNSVDQ